MKIRNGFVSNSSSSSFMIVGVTFDYRFGEPRATALAVADEVNLDGGWGGEYEGKTLVFLGGEWGYELENAKKQRESYEPYYIGIHASEELKAGKTVQELKQEFIEKAKALGVDFAENEVDLRYGEVSSE